MDNALNKLALMIVNARKPKVAPKVEDPKQRELRILTKNMIDQTAYTPAAQQRIQSLPKDMMQDAEGAPLGQYRRDADKLFMNEAVMQNREGALPAEIFRHEAGHSMDQNILGKSVPYGGFSSGAYGDVLGSNNPGFTTYMQRPFPQNPTPQLQDTESFAQGASLGEKILLNQLLKDRYSNIYQPMNKKINYSPKYPTQQTLRAAIERYKLK